MSVRDLLFVGVICAVWGFNFVTIKVAMAELGPFTVSTLRFIMVLACLIPFLKWMPGRMGRVMLVGLFLGVLHFSTFVYAISLADGVGAIAILSQLYVPIATVLAFFFFGETFGKWRMGGIAICVLGTLMLAFDPAVFDMLDAVLWILINAVCYAAATLAMRSLRDVPALTTQSWAAVVAIAGNTVLAVAFEPVALEPILDFSALGWLCVAFSAVGATIIGHGGVNYLLGKYEVGAVTPYLLAAPIFGTISSALVFGDAISVQFVIGAAIVLLGVLIITVRAGSKSAAAVATAAARQPAEECR